jgi:hypothetical protein
MGSYPLQKKIFEQSFKQTFKRLWHRRMPTKPVRLLDPEIVIPSPSSSETLVFWERMNEWARDRAPRIGPSTMQALYAIASNPPTVEGLPSGDFWAILGKYTSRGLPVSDNRREICDDHLLVGYRPLLGADENRMRLASDIRASQSQGRLALSTIQPCWTCSDNPSCPRCELSTVSRIHGPIGPGEASNDLADVWRRAYLAEHHADWSALSIFAADLFPAIEFSRVAWNQLNTLVGAPEETVSSVITHLSVLNDLAEEIWASELTSQGRQARLGANGVTASLEGPKTHRNAKAMKTRDFDFQTGVVRCEWHTKLRPETNRIYFAVDEGKVLVGLIVDHLPT